MSEEARYQKVSTYGPAGTDIEYVEAIVQFGMYGFAGKGATAEEAKDDLCQRIAGQIGWLQRSLDELRAAPVGKVEKVD